jgi:SAM-dependent methyltransferase
MHFGLGRRLIWRMRLETEVEFWADWLTGAPGTEQWATDREKRLNPETEVEDPLVRAELEGIPTEKISILDVGAGPLTALGYRFPGKTLTVVPVDPLADEYDRLLVGAGIDPPVRTIRVSGEALPEHFGPGTFDIAYAVNALDHSADPFLIISNMVAVVRPGGAVLLRHKRNEGKNARYGGLHQWNFDAADGALILWNSAARIEVGSELAGRATATAWTAPHFRDNESIDVVARLVVGEAA